MIRWENLDSLGTTAAFSERTDGDARRLPEGEASPGRVAVCEASGIAPADLVCAEQVHGVAVAVVRAEDRGRGSRLGLPPFPKTDALVTDVPGLPLTISVADCVPVYIVDPERRAIGLAHAGRAGTLGAIAARTVEAMQTAYGCEPAGLTALIGPSAGPTRYEVSSEMADEWAAVGLPRTGRLLDLWGANRLQLESAGLHANRIHLSGHCTLATDRFHSHRRHADGCRNMALLSLR